MIVRQNQGTALLLWTRACANLNSKKSGTDGGVVLFVVEAMVAGDSGLVEGVAPTIVSIYLAKRQNEPKLGRSKRDLLHFIETTNQGRIVQLLLFTLLARGLQRLQILERVAIVTLET